MAPFSSRCFFSGSWLPPLASSTTLLSSGCCTLYLPPLASAVSWDALLSFASPLRSSSTLQTLASRGFARASTQAPSVAQLRQLGCVLWWRTHLGFSPRPRSLLEPLHFFWAPAACWCARTMLPSRKLRPQSRSPSSCACCRRVSKRRVQSPIFCQR